MSTDEFQAAGLYDPDDAGAASRLALLEYLVAAGMSMRDLVAAERTGGLVSLATEIPLRAGGEPLDLDEVARRSGTTPDRVRRVRLASGLTPDPGDVGLPPSVVEDVRAFEAGAQLFGETATLSFTRVMGAAVSRVADAAVSLFLTERRPGLAGAGELELARAAEEATAVFLDVTPRLMATLLREHMALAIRRSVTERTLEDDDLAVTVGLAFVDLVGSTAWSSTLTLKEHALALAGFERAAWDIATDHGGRVVKLIGDEAMFIAPTGSAAARIAVELCRELRRAGDLPEARGAAGFGTVGARDGDYFGPLVNLVARAVKAADPGSVVVTEAVRDDLHDTADRDGGGVVEALELVELSARRLRGVGEDVRLFAVR